MKIVMLDRTGADFSLEKKTFHKEGASFIVTYFNDAESLLSIAKDADVLLYNDAVLSADMIGALEKCKLIMAYGAESPNVDLRAAGEHGIYVAVAPSYGICDAAEHTMALLLSFARRIPHGNRCVQNGLWKPEAVGQSRRLSGKALGIIGAGPIAKLVSARARAFDMQVLVFDPYAEPESIAGIGERLLDFSAILENSDYVSLHIPHTEDTHHFMGMPQFKRMKKDAVLINTTHGGLVNENELVYALLSGEIGGAALDVFETEPLPGSSRLLQMENVILSPHTAWNSMESGADLHGEVIQNVIRVIHGEIPHHIVNQKFLKRPRI